MKTIQIIFISICLLTAACDVAGAATPPPSPPISLEVVFRDYLLTLGGIDTLGEVISNPSMLGNQKIQFLEKGLLYYDPLSEDQRSVKFWPIGKQLDIEESPTDPSNNLEPGAFYINGHTIPADMGLKFRSLGGEATVGKPITELRYNQKFRRFEQYFENLGFYREEDDPNGEIHLLSYGSWMCKNECREGSNRKGVVDIQAPVPEPFDFAVRSMGNDFTGYLLDSFVNNENGQLEGIFQNLVLRADPNQSTLVSIIPIPEMIGILAGEPGFSKNMPGMVFIPLTDDQKGFDVPDYFIQYIQEHGGAEVSGPPITEYDSHGNEFRQCFRNLCLLYDIMKSPNLRIQPESLGYLYLHVRHRSGDVSIEKSEVSLEDQTKNVDEESIVSLKIWEDQPYVSPESVQTINIQVFGRNQQPMSGVYAKLSIDLQEEGKLNYEFPQTSIDGKSKIDVPVLIIRNSSVVTYRVCAQGPNNQVCEDGNYLIWQDP